MPELHLGAALLFLVPGLLAYCALYGIFGSGLKISVAPPPANSIEALTVVLLASLFAHAAALGLVAIDTGLCVTTGRCLGLSDMTTLIFASLGDGQLTAARAGTILAAALAEGVAVYFVIRLWLRRLTKRDRLPVWLYGWTADIANLLDNADRLVVAYVLATQEADNRSVVYAGAVFDMAVARDGAVTRITLERCERYLVAMDRTLTGKPLSRFALMTIERENIRNIAFEPFILADPAAPAAIAA